MRNENQTFEFSALENVILALSLSLNLVHFPRCWEDNFLIEKEIVPSSNSLSAGFSDERPDYIGCNSLIASCIYVVGDINLRICLPTLCSKVADHIVEISIQVTTT